MDIKRRRAIASSLGKIDLGEVQQKPVLRVGNDEPLYSASSSDNFETDEEIEKEIREAKEQKKNQRASKGSINRLEILTGIGRLVRDVEIEGVVFSIRSLKNKELREVIEAPSNNPGVAEALIIRDAVLAKAIFEIDGVPFKQFCIDMTPEEVIDEMDGGVISQLYKEYSQMLIEHQNSLVEDLGSSPKEVVENIKKS
jgi:hypothetical protein